MKSIGRMREQKKIEERTGGRAKVKGKSLTGVFCQRPEKQFPCKVLFFCYSELWLRSNQHDSCANSTLKPGISHVRLAFELHEVPLAPSSFLWNYRSPIKVNSYLPKCH